MITLYVKRFESVYSIKKASQNIKKSTHIILKFEKGQIGSNVSESIQILLNSLATVAKYLAPFK